MSDFLEFDALRVRYAGREEDAVDGISLSVARGEFACLVGESGSGKSSAVMAALGLLPAGAERGGRIFFDGLDLFSLSPEEMRRLRGRRLALVPQGAQSSFTPVRSIGSHIDEVLRVHFGIKGAEAQRRTAGLLESVGLDASIARRYPHELSGGQKQRAAIAAALAGEPDVLFADEPTTALDVITQAGILELLNGLRVERNLAVLLVSHDLPMAASVASKMFVMKDGLIVESGAPADIVRAPKHAYTRHLVAAAM